MNKTSGDKYKVSKCRICGKSNLYKFLDLGSMPIPNGFLKKDDLNKEELKYPLATYFCESCGLMQLTHVVPAEIMFKNYLYIPSTSTTMLQHFKEFADSEIEIFRLDSNDLVIDIGSNDGTLLSYFKEHEIKVLGIDPASNLAQVARLKGIDTIDNFFTDEIAKVVLKSHGKASLITATNVVAHIDNLHDFVNGVERLLCDKGVLIAEFPYMADLLDKNEFDTIYHEHLSYFAIKPLIELFKQHNMYIFNVKRVPIHGGSIRVYVAKNESKYQITESVNNFVKDEILRKLDKRETYDEFTRRVEIIKRDLIDYLANTKKQGKSIVGYGAAAKGNVLLNYCGITTKFLDYIVDSIPYKQGLYTPGTHIPIYPESRLEKDLPEFTLILAWNFADEIIRKQMKYREKGGRFIVTIPYLRVE